MYNKSDAIFSLFVPHIFTENVAQKKYSITLMKKFEQTNTNVNNISM